MDGHSLKTLRKKANLTREDLCAATGISYSSIAKYEGNHVGEPSYRHVKAIAEVIAKGLQEPVNKVLTILDGKEKELVAA